MLKGFKEIMLNSFCVSPCYSMVAHELPRSNDMTNASLAGTIIRNEMIVVSTKPSKARKETCLLSLIQDSEVYRGPG